MYILWLVAITLEEFVFFFLWKIIFHLNKLPAVSGVFASGLFGIFANIILKLQTMVRKSWTPLRRFDT